MARLARLAFAGHAHLVVLAGVEEQPLFADDEDRRRFMVALLECSRACGVALHAYALLDDQVLMLATPAADGALARFMQRLGRKYVAGFNRRHGRSGPLWSRRYGAVAIDPASQGWRCIRLIEQAPVRAGRVAHPRDWPWSSAAHHVGGARNPLVREHELHWRLGNTPFEREARHAQAIAEPLAEHEVRTLVAAAMRGWPLGPRPFVDALAGTAQKPVQPRPRGRPRVSRSASAVS
jgi:putative transposase